MNNGPYTVGQAIRVKFTFEDFDGTITEPATHTLRWRAPDGTESTADSSSQVAPGIWYSVKVATSAGSWVARAETTGSIRAPKEVFCWVAPSMYTNPV